MPEPRRFVLVPAGSTGDVLPFLWLGSLLRERGHEVVAVIHAPFGNTFRSAGIRAVEYGTTEDDFEVVIRHPDLWHPQRGFALLARMAERWSRLALPALRQEVAGVPATLVAAALAFGARITHEALQVPLVTVHLQPACLFSVEAPPLLRARLERFTEAPRWVRRLMMQIVWWQTDWLLAGPINEIRSEQGLLRPQRRILRDYWVSPSRVLGLFPDWYARPQRDWPPQTVLTRFPPRDRGDEQISPDLEEFMRAGPPPILFTPGTANVQARDFFAEATEACRLLGARGLFMTPFREQVPASRSPDVGHFERAPFNRLFPRCRAIVHHGGIGTVAEAFAAGTPQLIMPMSHDQPDNALRVRRLGAGDYLYPREFRATAVAQRLQQLTTSSDVGHACRDVRERMQHQVEPEIVLRCLEEAR